MTTPYQTMVLSEPSLASFAPCNEVSPAPYFVDLVTGYNSDTFHVPAGPTPADAQAAPARLGGWAPFQSTFGQAIQFPNPFYGNNQLVITAEFWFSSTTSFSGGTVVGLNTPWYSGAAGLFSDISGQGIDWGIGLVGNMQPVMGVGNPDTSICAQGSWNDGQWHHAVGTWNSAAGIMKIYVDGQLNATLSSGVPTGPHGGNVLWWSGTNATEFVGQTNNFAVYNATLSDATILAHYNSSLFAYNRPENLIATLTSPFTVGLAWDASVPVVGSTPPYGYEIFRDGVSLGTTTGLSFSDTVPITATYTYTVAAWDGTVDVSPLSLPAAINTGGSIVLYGKFAGAKAFLPTLLIDAKGIKPRIYMPHENTTVQT